MSSDDQYFLDVLSSIPNDVKRYSTDIADSIDRHFELVALALRDALSSTPWLPDVARPSPRPPPPPRKLPTPPRSTWERASRWVGDHKLLVAALVISVGATGFLVLRRRKAYSRKRRARRASNGARREVVVVAGSPKNPIARSLSLDLERRGFIVYVVVTSDDEEQMIRNEARVDIRSLFLDIIDPHHTQLAIGQFNRILISPQHAFAGANPHNLQLAAVIMIPDMMFPSGPVETISPELWSDALNVKVLGTIATTQAFLETITEFRSRLLFLTPAIIPSLKPPFHGPESAIVAALDAFSSSLSAELATLGIDVAQFRLGTFDCGSVGGKSHLQPANATRADVLSWPSTARAAYARNYFVHSGGPGNRGTMMASGAGALRGTPLRELHNAVFDAITTSRPRRVWHVGSGSLLYDMVGRFVPAGIVGWMLGIRQVSRIEYGIMAETTDWEKVEGLV